MKPLGNNSVIEQQWASTKHIVFFDSILIVFDTLIGKGNERNPYLCVYDPIEFDC